MTTNLARGMVVSDANIWKGAARLLTSVSTWAVLFPTYDPVTSPPLLEQIIHTRDLPAHTPSPIVGFTLATGWVDFGALTEDGVTITREWDESAGINIDQRDTPLRGGVPNNVRMSLSATSVYNDQTTLDYLWQTGTTGTVLTAPGAGAAEGNVAQRNLTVGETKTLAERRVAVVQQSDTLTGTVSGIYKTRAFLFRNGVLSPPSAIKWSSRAHTTQDFAIRFRPDASVTDGTEFGWYLEQTGA